jgi:hypothetical protein
MSGAGRTLIEPAAAAALVAAQFPRWADLPER